MPIFDELTSFVQSVFKTDLEKFLEALKLSPNAQGYVSGSIAELLLKKKLEERYQLEVKRIKEKWEGGKHPNHRGDFYFRKPHETDWYVMESKGVKSNSEAWHQLYNFDKLKTFLINHANKITWVDKGQDVEQQIADWINANLPNFQTEYKQNLYKFDERNKYLESPPRRDTAKLRAMRALEHLTREQIGEKIDRRLEYVMSRVKVLETHFVSGRSGSSERTQATPKKNEFNVVSVDIFLRFPEHKFLFANPQHLEPSGDDPNHLQQNYIMGFVFTDEQGNSTLSITEEWHEEFSVVSDTLRPADSIDEDDMQIDNRYVVVGEEE